MNAATKSNIFVSKPRRRIFAGVRPSEGILRPLETATDDADGSTESPKSYAAKHTKKAESAIYGVINTVELLEDILGRIDPETLLLSQRVNKRFRDTIIGSSVLQQKLFFQLEASPEVVSDETDARVNPLLIPRIKELGPSLYVPSDRKVRAFAGCIKFGCWQQESYAPDGKTSETIHHLRLDLHNVGDFPPQATAGASWRNMYIYHNKGPADTIDWRFNVFQGERINSSANIRLGARHITAGELYDRAWVDAADTGCFARQEEDGAMWTEAGLNDDSEWLCSKKKRPRFL